MSFTPSTCSRERKQSDDAAASLTSAFTVAGLAAPGKRLWDQTSAIDTLRLFATENGRPPTRTEWRAADGTERPKTATIERLFGSWSEALHAAALTPHHPEWKPEQIIAALGDWTIQHGWPPAQADWRSDSTGARPSASVAAHHFGSWTAALEAADILPPFLRRWNRREVVAAMRAFAREHDRAPTSIDWRQRTTEHPGAGTISKISAHGRRASSPPASNPTRSPGIASGSSRHCVTGRSSTAGHHADRSGRPATPTHARPTTKTVHNHFGSWQAALRAAKHTPTNCAGIPPAGQAL
jgi:hypothetical protein